MKKIAVFAFACLVSGGLAAQEKEGVKEEGAHQAEYNADAQDRDGTGEIDSRVQPGEEGVDTVADPGAQSSDPDQRANTSGADTRTTSSSGSPGILMESADEPDGTNTMQRATLNIAGSPLPGAPQGNTKPLGSDDRSEMRKFDGEPQQSVPGMTGEDRERRPGKKKKK